MPVMCIYTAVSRPEEVDDVNIYTHGKMKCYSSSSASFAPSFAGTNWGLPLAIAANLHIPYRIELNQSYAGEIEDKLGAGKSSIHVYLNYF